MQSFQDWSVAFEKEFSGRHFPDQPARLYDAAQYILSLGGKRVRPVALCMANELFAPVEPDAFRVASAIELFHNFTLIHDDIMDKAPLRRGKPTVHMQFGESTALLAGDVMLVKAYEYIQLIHPNYQSRVLQLFNQTAREVCEGQQQDMDFEQLATVSMDEYLGMITLKTSVLLAASLSLGGILGGASRHSQGHLYEFGKNLGIAFQLQDDYLDAFGDPAMVGKQPGGDIMANKKTFLMIHALQESSEADKIVLHDLMQQNPPDKVERVLSIFKKAGSDAWARVLKENYFEKAMYHLREVAVITDRKTELEKLAQFLLHREH